MRQSINAIFLLLIITTIGCKKDEPLPTAEELITGKWIIDSSEILATVVPGDGSYLTFEACSSDCSGVDYKQSDTSIGAFTYTINEGATILTISDVSSDGGSWSGEWDVLELTDSDLRITTTTVLGSMKVEMIK